MKKQKQNDAPNVKLTRMQRMKLKYDREILRDMGLRMPRITPKYWSAIQIVSSKSFTSTTFYHIAAARKGQQVFYNELKNLGYEWQNGKWVRTKKEKSVT